MVTPINLRRARKERERAAKRQQADANAAKHGRTKARRAAEKAENAQAIKKLDAHRREP